MSIMGWIYMKIAKIEIIEYQGLKVDIETYRMIWDEVHDETRDGEGGF